MGFKGSRRSEGLWKPVFASSRKFSALVWRSYITARKIKEMLDVHPYVYRSVAVLVTMVFALHFFSCLLWRIKVTRNKQQTNFSRCWKFFFCTWFCCPHKYANQLRKTKNQVKLIFLLQWEGDREELNHFLNDRRLSGEVFNALHLD